MRQLRAELVGRLAGVHSIGDIPFDIHRHIRAEATQLLGDPAAYPFQGRGCGGDVAPSGGFAQETRIGHYE